MAMRTGGHFSQNEIVELDYLASSVLLIHSLFISGTGRRLLLSLGNSGHVWLNETQSSFQQLVLLYDLLFY